MKITQEEFDLLLRKWISHNVILEYKESKLDNDKLIKIVQDALQHRLKQIKEALNFSEKIKGIDINHMSEEDIENLAYHALYSNAIVRNSKSFKSRMRISNLVKRVSEELIAFDDDFYVNNLKTLKSLLERAEIEFKRETPIMIITEKKANQKKENNIKGV
jgi:hypothetical protein